MQTYTYIWAVDASERYAEATVFEREGRGENVPVGQLAIDLSLFDTKEKIEAEARNFAEEVQRARQTKTVLPTGTRAEIVSELRRAAPKASIELRRTNE